MEIARGNPITRRTALARIGAGATIAAADAPVEATPADSALFKLVEQWHATWPRFVEAGRELWRVIQDNQAAKLTAADVRHRRAELAMEKSGSKVRSVITRSRMPRTS